MLELILQQDLLHQEVQLEALLPAADLPVQSEVRLQDHHPAVQQADRQVVAAAAVPREAVTKRVHQQT